ncbi:MAG: heme-binding protein [Acidobacteriota bacterium]
MSLSRIILALALTIAAFGQTPAAAPATNTPYGISISSDTAKKLAAAAIAEARKNNWAMAISIVATGGYLVYFERMPDTQLGSVDVSLQKAKSAVLFRRPTKSFQDTVAGGGVGLRMLGLPGAVPVDGGLPIIVDGKIIGAIGAPAAPATRMVKSRQPDSPHPNNRSAHEHPDPRRDRRLRLRSHHLVRPATPRWPVHASASRRRTNRLSG